MFSTASTKLPKCEWYSPTKGSVPVFSICCYSGYNHTSSLIILSIFISGFNRYSLVADRQTDRQPGLSNRVPFSLFGTESLKTIHDDILIN